MQNYLKIYGDTGNVAINKRHIIKICTRGRNDQRWKKGAALKLFLVGGSVVYMGLEGEENEEFRAVLKEID
jgi:hypothetical protein